MKKLLLSAVCFLLVAGSAARAEVFKFANVDASTFKTKVIDKASGKFLWEATTKRQKITYKGEPFLFIVQDGAGIYGKDKAFKSWHDEAFYRLEGGQVLPYQTTRTYKNQKGEVIQTVGKFYYAAEKKAVVIIDPGQKRKDFELKEDLINSELIGTALPNYPFDEKRDFVFHLLTDGPTVYKMTLKYRGMEALNIGGAAIECYKIEMIPDLGALNLLGAFVPKTYFWLKTTSPHNIVKYEGLESELGTPYIVMDTTP